MVMLSDAAEPLLIKVTSIKFEVIEKCFNIFRLLRDTLILCEHIWIILPEQDSSLEIKIYSYVTYLLLYYIN